MTLTCPICHNNFHAKPSWVLYGRKYCSDKCKFISQRKGKIVICFSCKKEIYKPKGYLKSKSGNYFCSHSCSATWSNTLRGGDLHPNWTDGEGSYSRRAKRIYGEKCFNGNDCPLKNIDLPSYMYEVDHIDGNHKNNKIENLRVLCVWCHRKKHWEKIIE